MSTVSLMVIVSYWALKHELGCILFHTQNINTSKTNKLHLFQQCEIKTIQDSERVDQAKKMRFKRVQ